MDSCHQFSTKLNKNTTISKQENEFENNIYKVAANSSQPKCANTIAKHCQFI